MRQIQRRPGREVQSLQDRLRGALAQKIGAPTGTESPSYTSTSALLLDISGSMNEFISAGVKKISELRKLAGEFTEVRRFVFNTTCRELQSTEDVPEAWAGTGLQVAFMKVKSVGIQHVVLITDGRPDNEYQALTASKGLRVDVFYVGPDPAPEFLRDLCRQTAGEYGKASLKAPKELGAAVRERLQIGDGRGGQG